MKIARLFGSVLEIRILVSLIGALVLMGGLSGCQTPGTYNSEYCQTVWKPDGTITETCARRTVVIPPPQPDEDEEPENPSGGACPNGLPREPDGTCPEPNCPNPDELGNCPDEEAWVDFIETRVQDMMDNGEINYFPIEEMEFTYSLDTLSGAVSVRVVTESEEYFEAMKEDQAYVMDTLIEEIGG